MLKRFLWFALLVCPALLFAATAPAHAQLRWAAMLQNGEIIEGNNFSEWHISPAHPNIDGQEVLHDENPFLWIRDRHRTPNSQPRSYVEFTQGDVLPGEVIGWRAGSASPYDAQQDFFVVATTEILGMGAENANPQVRVNPRYVRRIVWQELPHTELKPGTLFYRNGRQLSFRSWRGGYEEISVLTDSGLEQVPLDEIAELHLPGPDFWESYCDEVATLLPNGEGRLLTFRTMAGMLATGSLSQLKVWPGAPSNQPDQWIQGIQPVWSLDPLWIRGITVWLRQSYLPTELPLNKLSPTEEVAVDVFGAGSWPWRRDLNVQGSRLEAGDLPCGWGFGVHAPSRLKVDLPLAAQSFEVAVAIDDVTDKGGCIQARVLAGSNRQVLFESEVLTGESSYVATGPLDLNGLRASQGTKTILLEVDPVLHNRPEGADPLDIRDHVDWLDPRVQLDPAALAEEVEKRFPHFIRVWEDWDVSMLQPELLEITNVAIDPTPLTSRTLFRYATNDVAAGITLSRTLPESTRDRWLLVSVHTTTGETAELEIRANGLPIATYQVPNFETARQNPAGFLLPLAPLDGLGARLEIVPRSRPGATAAPPLVWKSLRVIDQLPMVYAIYSDEPQLLTRESLEVAEIITDPALVHSGAAALRVPAEQTVELSFPRPIMIDGEPDWGEYRYMRFVMKKQGGMASIEFLHNGEPERVLSYEAGAGESQHEDSLRVWTLELGGDWIVLTRDMYSDFGQSELTGLRITTQGEEPLYLDQVLLSRRSDGFDTMPPPPSAEYESMATLLHDADPAAIDALAATAHLVIDGMHSMALCVDPEGYLVTSGDFAGGIGREAVVYFRDMPETRAVVHAIDREHNLGLWKIVDAGPWPATTKFAAAPATTGTAVLRLGLLTGEQWRPVRVQETEIGLAGDRYLKAVNDPPGDCLPWGGVMMNTGGEILGVARDRQPDSVPAYTQASVLTAQLARLKQGGAYGSWEAHTTPKLGITLTPAEGGMQITAVEGNTPAAAIGIQVNDILTKFDGQAITTQEQFDTLLRQRDAQQVLSLELKRGEEVLTLTPTLLPLPQ